MFAPLPTSTKDCGQTEQERNSFSKCDAPHMDLDGDTYGEVLPFVSIWFAMTEADAVA